MIEHNPQPEHSFFEPELNPATGLIRSPIRPKRPEEQSVSSPEVLPEALQSVIAEDPKTTLDHIREKMERVAGEFAAGKINRPQFNAIYAHYSEQRLIIERLIQRNPTNDAWKQVARLGRTNFLREHFEAVPLYFLVFRHHERQPLLTGGTLPPDSLTHIVQTLKQLWLMPQLPTAKVARKPINDGRWLVLSPGEHTVTLAIFSLQPSNLQADLILDLHHDFERANRISLQRRLSIERMVFPQRSLFK